MRLYPLNVGNFKLDGGAMFGVVPKTIWSKTNPADQNNMIDIAARCLLVENGDRLILIDTGMGNKQTNKFFSYYYRWGDQGVEQALAKYGFHKDAFSILEKYYDPGEFNEGRQKMSKMPITASLILNPTSGAPGFYVKNVFCLPGVPSILKSMIGGLNNVLIGGQPILSKTINLRTYESEIAKSLTEVQNNNQDVDIGSYPFFRAGKLGVSIVLRSIDKKKIDNCSST